MSRPRKYPPELLDRGARLVFERHAARGMTLVMPRRSLCRIDEGGRGGVP